MALHAFNLAITQRLAVDITRFEESIELRGIPQPCPIAIAPTDFPHSAELIARSETLARKWLSTPHPATGQAAMLAPHCHGPNRA